MNENIQIMDTNAPAIQNKNENTKKHEQNVPAMQNNNENTKFMEEKEGRARVEKRKAIIDEALIEYHEKKMKRDEGDKETRTVSSASSPPSANTESEDREVEEGPEGKRRRILADIELQRTLVLDLTMPELSKKGVKELFKKTSEREACTGNIG